MQSASELKSLLARIDRRGYPAYKETRGSYQFPGYLLSIDHVQGDPFAAPSRLSIRVQGKDAAFPPALYRLGCQRVALEDALLRRFGHLTQQVSFTAKGSGHSGLISVSRCSSEPLAGLTLSGVICCCGLRWDFRPTGERSMRGSWKRFYLSCCPAA